MDSNTVTAAADPLGQTVSGISRALGRLEKKLVATRRLALDDEGLTFLTRTRAILAALDEAEDELAAQRQS